MGGVWGGLCYSMLVIVEILFRGFETNETYL